MAFITLRDVVKEYPGSGSAAPLRAVDSVSLEVERGQVWGIIGYSGAGKSTLVRLLNALEPVTSGSIRIDGEEITGMDEAALCSLRSGIGMIFQQFNLFSSRTVAGNVEYPLRIAGRPAAERKKRVAELLEFVGLDERARNYPDQLSGGQKQRVGIARALATNPDILLADEATSALDPQTTSDVLALLRRANEELGVTIVVITHEMDVVKTICSHVAVMEQGRIIERGEVFDVFSEPKHPATRRFVSTVVQGVPNPFEVEELRRRHPGARIATVSVRPEHGEQGEILRRFHEAGTDVQLVFGGLNEIRGRSFGHLTFAVTGPEDRTDAALRSVGEVANVTIPLTHAEIAAQAAQAPTGPERAPETQHGEERDA